MPASREPLPALPGTALAAGPAHLGYAAAVGAALTAALVGWAVTAFPARKQLTWAVEVDTPVGLTPGRSPGADWTLIFAEHDHRPAHPHPDGAAEGWLVLVTVTNTGLTPVRGEDFQAPSVFWFPGREVCGVRIYPDPAGMRSGRRTPLLQAAIDDSGPSAPGIELGRELLLHRNDAFTLMTVLRGTPARALPPVSLEGELTGGTIVAAESGGPPASRWGAVCAAAAVLLAAMLLGLLLGTAS